MKQTYIGSKIIVAQDMSRGAYNGYRGWATPERENAEDEGYLVEYPDSAPNHPDHAGYISWSPKSVFDHSHVLIGDTTGLPPFVVRLLGERAELNDRLNKLNAFLAKDDVPVDDINLQLLIAQQETMTKLLDILSQRLNVIDPGVTIDGEATIKMPIANGSRLNLIAPVVEALALDACCYSGHIVAIENTKVVDAEGNDIANSSAPVDKMLRGFGISGNIGEDLFDIGIDRERGMAHSTSSFTDELYLVMTVKLGNRNRLPLFA